MALKLKKTQIATLLEYARDMRTLAEAAEVCIKALNDKRSAVLDLVDGLASDFRAEWDDASDGWKEGDRGTTANEFVESFEAIGQEHEMDLSLDNDPEELCLALEGLDHEVFYG